MDAWNINIQNRLQKQWNRKQINDHVIDAQLVKANKQLNEKMVKHVNIRSLIMN